MIINAAEIVKKLLLPDTAEVADLGSGTGEFTLAAAQYFCNGKIYAVDIQKILLPIIFKKVSEKDCKNVEVISGDIEKLGGTKLKDQSMDGVILANTLFQIEDKNSVANEIKRILKPGGKLLCIDWTGNTPGFGPTKDNIVSQEKALQLFLDAGFIFKQEIPVGEYHYGIILLCP